MLIYREQPHVVYGDRRQHDPMSILSALDNTDKHRLLQHSFAYPTAERGLDLIKVRDRNMVLAEDNVWTSGEPIEHGTVMARFRIRGRAEGLLRVDRNADVRLSTGVAVMGRAGEGLIVVLWRACSLEDRNEITADDWD